MLVLSVAIATPAAAEDNLDAGKSSVQIFSSDCSICHKSPQGLAKGGTLGLDSFLRTHYMASKESAAAMANFLRAAGDAPAAPVARGGKPPKDANPPTVAQPAAVEQPPAQEPDFFRSFFGGPKPEPAPPAKPVAKKPAKKKPAEDATAAKPPADTPPADAKASEPKPAAAEVKPAAAAEAPKPAEAAKPAEPKPVEAKPVEAKPVEAKPAQ